MIPIISISIVVIIAVITIIGILPPLVGIIITETSSAASSVIIMNFGSIFVIQYCVAITSCFYATVYDFR